MQLNTSEIASASASEASTTAPQARDNGTYSRTTRRSLSQRVRNQLRLFRDLVRVLYEDRETHSRDWTSPGFRALAVYRFGRWHLSLPKGLRLPIGIVYTWLHRWIRNHYGIEISILAHIGCRLRFHNHGGTIIYPSSVIGDDCSLWQNVVIGGPPGRVPRAAYLGNRVHLGSGVVVSPSVVVGEDVEIAPCVQVSRDVPPHSAVPSRPIVIHPKPHEVRGHSIPKHSARQLSRIGPPSRWPSAQLGELWRHRELIVFFAWRDVKVRYAHTFLGALWAILQPLLTMVVFVVFLGMLARMPTEGVPHSVFYYTALIPWMFFSNSVMQASMSVVSNGNLVKKVYFPRMAIPIGSVLAAVVDLCFTLPILAILLWWTGIGFTINVLWLPLILLLTACTGLGAGLWLSAMYVYFRDVQHIVPFLLRLGMFVTPIIYPSSLIPEQWRTVYALNPLVGVVEGFRWAVLGTTEVPAVPLLLSSVVVACVLVSGTFFFRRMEEYFSDFA